MSNLVMSPEELKKERDKLFKLLNMNDPVEATPENINKLGEMPTHLPFEGGDTGVGIKPGSNPDGKILTEVPANSLSRQKGPGPITRLVSQKLGETLDTPDVRESITAQLSDAIRGGDIEKATSILKLSNQLAGQANRSDLASFDLAFNPEGFSAQDSVLAEEKESPQDVAAKRQGRLANRQMQILNADQSKTKLEADLISRRADFKNKADEKRLRTETMGQSRLLALKESYIKELSQTALGSPSEARLFKVIEIINERLAEEFGR